MVVVSLHLEAVLLVVVLILPVVDPTPAASAAVSTTGGFNIMAPFLYSRIATTSRVCIEETTTPRNAITTVGRVASDSPSRLIFPVTAVSQSFACDCA